nr:putative ribonuclease H-like domain-containing protein [Tanacetum cinerariifolium]
KETVSAQQYVLLPLWSLGSQDPQNSDADVADAAFDVKESEKEVHVSPSSSNKPKKHDEKAKGDDRGKSHVDLSIKVRDLRAEFEEYSINSTNMVNVANTPVTATRPNPTNSTNSFNTASPSNTTVSPNFRIARKSSFVDPSNSPDDSDMPALEDIVYSDDEEDVGAKADFSNLETSIFEEGKDYDEVFAHVARIGAIWLFLAYASFMGFMVYQMDVKSAFLYGTIEEEVYVCQPSGFKDPDYPDNVYKVVKALYGLHQAPKAWYETLANYLLEISFQRGKIDQTLFIKKQKRDIQVYVDDIIFGSTNKELCKAFEKLMKDKFKMSSIGELTFFLGLQTVVATSSTEVEYVAVASCCAQVLWIQNQLLDYGPEQTAPGKDLSNPLMADNLPKIIWYSTHHVATFKSWLVQKKTALGKDKPNLFLAGSLPKTKCKTTFIHGICIDMDPIEFSLVYLVVTSVLVMNRGMLLYVY